MGGLRERPRNRHVGLTIRYNPQAPQDGLNQVARVRDDLFKHLHIMIPSGDDEPYAEPKFDAPGNVSLQFPTARPTEVRRVLREAGYDRRITMEDLGEVGIICPQCGFIGGYHTVCPNCQLRDIDPCPHCGKEVATQHYLPTSHETLACPHCRGIVRMEFNPGVRGLNGRFYGPVIIVEKALG